MVPTPSSVARVLIDLEATFESLGLAWYVFGAQALVLRGLPRATADVDVTVIPESTSTTEILRALEGHGFVGRVTNPDFVEATRVLPVWHEASRFPVDVVLGGPGLEELFAEGASTIDIGPEGVPVASPTHLAVMKLVAGQPKDMEDVRWLLGRPGEVDREALQELVDQLVAALSDDDLRERELTPTALLAALR